jgi:hypothetical protein
MKAVLDWVKTNVFTVVFLVVMIAALVALPFVAGSMNEGVRKTGDERKKQYQNLGQLEKTPVEVPDEGGGAPNAQTILVNQQFLDRYKAVTEAQAEDAEHVREIAEAHNRKGRGVLLDNLFPAPPPTLKEVLPEDFHERLVAAYDALLEEINAGPPPSAEEMNEFIAQRQAQFRDQILQKGEEESLSPEEMEQLTEELTNERMSRYALAAENIGLYVDTIVLGVPEWNYSIRPSMTELFDWQWDYWIMSDVLRALSEANTKDDERLDVANAPVKRVLGLVVYQHDGRGAAGGGGRAGLGAPGRGAPEAGAGGVRLDYKQEAPLDYTQTFTGRKTNPLYDVRSVGLDVVVDTAALPAIMDALARYNFITVLDVDMSTVDPYEHIHGGYYYGSDPVSRLSIMLETVWLRNWTKQFMPDELRQALNIAPDTPPTPSAG